MKRDMDLMRHILLEIERWPFHDNVGSVEIPNHSEEEISYHIYLLADAGLIEAFDVSDMSGPKWLARRLTYQGHEFLDAARQDTLWTKAKETVTKSTGTLTLEALKTALSLLMQKAITSGI